MLTADTSSSPRMARRLSVSMSWSSWTNFRFPVGILSFARAWNMNASSGSGLCPTRMSCCAVAVVMAIALFVELGRRAVRGERLFDRPGVHHPAGFEDDDPVGDPADGGDVVGDDHHRGLELLVVRQVV